MNPRILIAIAAAGAFGLALVAPASAEGDNATGDQHAGKAASGRTANAALFERLDKNKDGFISRDEARDATELQGRFAELDVDNDGKISRSEWRALDKERAPGAAASGKTR